MRELVFKSDKGNPVTNSLLVAEAFGKQHKHVLRDIENLAAQNSAAKFFYKATYENRGKNYPMYIMNRDGFSLLVMGFTGEKALMFKIKFIEAFNRMETELKGQLLPDFSNPAIAARAWADEYEHRTVAESKVKALQPKADYADRVILTDTKVDIGQAAKLLKLPFGRNTFFRKLRESGVFFKNRNEPKQHYIEKGYFEMFMVTFETEHHGTMSVPKITVTQRGMFWLAKKFESEYRNGLPQLNSQ